jgi:hypothetical protein
VAVVAADAASADRRTKPTDFGERISGAGFWPALCFWVRGEPTFSTAIKRPLGIAAAFAAGCGTPRQDGRYGGMAMNDTLERLEGPKCKFCSGRLRFDFERKTKAPGFSYFRCEQCEMPNVFAAATFAATASPA